ncbi:hypothetical protein EXA21_12465 [Vibrio cincinnatiensis]|uniref:hypothetical protein n=1 Tax=Vibrio cincinnatiensis TaxID=675 RepID=UPI001EDE83D2|nr:hypothetical protein [Vibrio cincinnatiensis]MCG3760336.1 hypothetical protein [Vibrio cincinnatiensis]MCG3763660.1 hypothetical protein [Vibrio cincinnatiensis]
MLYSLLSVVSSMLLGTQLLLTLVLVKGDICPGQRGRLHKVLPVLAVLWLAVASLKIESCLIVFALLYFYSQVQTKKTRHEGPLWVLYLADGLALAFVAIVMAQSLNGSMAITLFSSIFLLGALLGHLLLTVVRTRLQAFHRILPVAGILSAMVTTLCIVPYAYQLAPDQLSVMIQPLLVSFSLLVAGIFAWCWHLLLVKPVAKAPLLIALLLMLVAVTGFYRLYL